MTDTSIRISEAVKRRLELERREGENFDDVLLRLTDLGKWSGYGALADEDEDARQGMQRVRRELRDGFGECGPDT